MRKRVIGVGFLLELIARGENRLFSPVKSGRFVFAEQKRETVRKADSFQNKSFAYGERRLKAKRNRIWPGSVTLHRIAF